MEYADLKLFHVVIASLLLFSFFHVIKAWLQKNKISPIFTLLIIILLLIQLVLGFTLFYLKPLTATFTKTYAGIWIKKTLITFALLSFSWFLFNAVKDSVKRLIAYFILSIFTASFVILIFLMSNT